MQLPALSPEELACIERGLPEETMWALASRIKSRLLASTGGKIEVLNCTALNQTGTGKPILRVEDKLVSAWLNKRFGGVPSRDGMGTWHSDLAGGMETLLMTALAETIINLGEQANWTQSMHMELGIDGVQGTIKINIAPRLAKDWSRNWLAQVSGRRQSCA